MSGGRNERRKIIMNKLFTKIAALALGATMAVGVGVAVASNSKVAEPVSAESATMTAGANSSAATVNSKSAIKCGTGKKAGVMTITVGSGATSLSFYAGGWNNDSGRQINFSVPTGVTISSNNFTVVNESAFTGSSSSFTVSDESIHLQEFTLTGVSSSTTITLTAKNASNNRYVVWGATYSTGGTSPVYTGVSVTGGSQQGTVKGSAYIQCSASASGTDIPASPSFNWYVTETNSYAATTSVANKASIDNTGKVTFLDSCTVYVWALAPDGSTHNTSGYAVTASGLTDPKGSEANPYSVAEARDAIDAETGTSSVYATGIVSEIITEYSSQYSNVTFDMVDSGATDTLRAYRCGGSYASTVAVGDTVVVYGDLTYYTSQSVYEFTSGCEITSLSKPVSSISISGTGISENALSIASGDNTAHTVSVSLAPSNASDQKVNIAHQSGTSNLFTKSASQITCSSGSGSFTLTGTGATSGSETFRISANSDSSKYVDLVVSAYDDSTTYWTVSFNSNGGSESPANQSVEDGETFTFPSPGTKEHYSFSGWKSPSDANLYATDATSPAVTAAITYTAQWAEDAKYNITYVAGDHGSGSNYVVSNVYAGSYELVSFETAGFTAASGYTFSKWSIGGVEYAAGTSVTISGHTTVTAVYKASEDFELFTGALVEGDYVIYADGNAMTNATASNRLTNTDVTPVNNKITDPDESIVWHISQSGDYWLIYNASVEKYAAGTAKNNAGLISESTSDTAKWTVSVSDGVYDFHNYGRSQGADSGNAYLRHNGSYGWAAYNTSTGDKPQLYKAPANQLSSIVISGQTTSFDSGDTFTFGGTVTAKYTKAADSVVTGSATFHLDSASGTSMAGVSLTHAAHDGHTIYVKYTENEITKTATYTISVGNAPVSSLTLVTNTGKVALTEYFDLSDIGVTILPADAVQTYTWTVISDTVSGDFEFEADIIAAGNTAGTITLQCASTADASKNQTFVLTISGDPVVSLPSADSIELFTGKTTTVSASAEGGTSPYTYSWSITAGGGNASISSGGSNATVTLSGTAAGSVTLQCTVTDANSKSDSASVTFSVVASAVTSVSWSATNFDVFSGATIPTNIDDTWMVNYEKNNGDADYILFGDYQLYIGEDLITELPYTFTAADDGKTLHVEYGGISSSSVSVAVTQSINNVYADVTSESTFTFTDKDWSYSEGVGEWSGSSGNGYSNDGVQVLIANSPLIVTGTTSYTNVSKIEVVYHTNKTSGSATLSMQVGSNASRSQTIGYDSSKTSDGRTYDFKATFDYATKQSGVVNFTVDTDTNSVYICSIKIVTSTGSTQIANNSSHKAAQRVAVKFANAFNAAMATTSNCTTNMSSAWSTCSSAYSTFLTEAAALGSAEELYAKNLVKYATAQYSDDSGEACIERMMKTYEVCVQKHGMTAFMSDLKPLGSASHTNPITIINSKTDVNVVAIVVVTSVISLTAIGGYFFLRKRREQN